MDKIKLTKDEAKSLLVEGESIHNFISNGFMLIGCDYTREDALKAIDDAVMCEIAGDQAKAFKHALGVWKTEKDVSFFETDINAVAKMEKQKESK